MLLGRLLLRRLVVNSFGCYELIAASGESPPTVNYGPTRLRKTRRNVLFNLAQIFSSANITQVYVAQLCEVYA